MTLQMLADSPLPASLLRTRHPRAVPPARSHDDGRTADQAQGLRQLFSGPSLCHLALVANPHVPGCAGVLERLGSALGTLGLRTLVVDAADTSPPAAELAGFDLRGCIERAVAAAVVSGRTRLAAAPCRQPRLGGGLARRTARRRTEARRCC